MPKVRRADGQSGPRDQDREAKMKWRDAEGGIVSREGFEPVPVSQGLGPMRDSALAPPRTVSHYPVLTYLGTSMKECPKSCGKWLKSAEKLR